MREDAQTRPLGGALPFAKRAFCNLSAELGVPFSGTRVSPVVRENCGAQFASRAGEGIGMPSRAVIKYLTKLQTGRIIRRLATNADASSIQNLVERSRAEFGLVLTPEDDDLKDLQAHYELAGGAFFVLEQEGQIVGTAGIMRKSLSTAVLTKFYLDPSLRGRGLARKFLKSTLGEAVSLGFEQIELETHRKMAKAERLYRALGFRLKSDKATHSQADKTLFKILKHD